MNSDRVERSFNLNGYKVLKLISSSKDVDYYLLVKSDEDSDSESGNDKYNRLTRFFGKSVILRKDNAKRRMKEVETIISLGRHPNIVDYVDSFLDRNRLNIIFKYCDQGSLESIIKNRNKRHFPENIIINWITQLLCGIKRIHDLGLIHRDSGGLIKICDFGIAKKSKRLNTFCGTMSYVSPEMHQYDYYTSKTDIWSAGVLLYYLIKLKLPFGYKKSDYRNIIYLICNEEIPPLPTAYSPELRQLCHKMLTKQHEFRPDVYDLLREDIIQVGTGNLEGITEMDKTNK